MYRDHEFDPITPEEQARREEEAEFARRVRREVRRMERGEADEEIRADEEREAAERAEAEAREARERRRRSSTFWQLFSGSILVRKGVSKYYPYLLTIAGMFFLSIVVMFWSLHLDMRYTRLSRRCCANARSACRSSVISGPPIRPSSNGCASAASNSTTRPSRVKSSKTDRR